MERLETTEDDSADRYSIDTRQHPVATTRMIARDHRHDHGHREQGSRGSFVGWFRPPAWQKTRPLHGCQKQPNTQSMVRYHNSCSFQTSSVPASRPLSASSSHGAQPRAAAAVGATAGLEARDWIMLCVRTNPSSDRGCVRATVPRTGVLMNEIRRDEQNLCCRRCSSYRCHYRPTWRPGITRRRRPRCPTGRFHFSGKSVCQTGFMRLFDGDEIG